MGINNPYVDVESTTNKPKTKPKKNKIKNNKRKIACVSEYVVTKSKSKEKNNIGMKDTK